ncbi:hypothetical protein ACFYRJ_17495 [Streptomyces sp. NPDC005531]|uniref:hypothetical protein n=1 Tax=Streptomyces sp. NPDC005531 TaxID=3364722 RepID=UPI003699C460
MAAQKLTGAPVRADHQGQCPARTAQGMRTPTGDYMTCAGGHAVGDLHGAAFGKSGWFSWTDDQAMSPADRLAHEAASYVRTARINMANPDGTLIRETAASDGLLELHDSTRPDVAPIVLDDFLMAVMRGEVQ